MVSTSSAEHASFGALLRQHRVAAGLSQEQLADRAGLSANAVSALERGARQAPYRDTVRLLADALGLERDARAALEATIVRGRRTSSSGSLGETASSLPVPPNRLIGREREIEEVCAILRGGATRLLTLTGPGGVGKTRLAIQAATIVADQYADGVAFVALASVRDATLVLPALAHALGVREGGDRPLLEGVHAHLRDVNLLLLLDNLEHLDEAAPLVSELLASTSGLRILATSRAALRLQGEQLYPVEPLATPDPAHLPSLEKLAQVPAVDLLLQRAGALMPSFALSPETARAMAAICSQLDGLPLALELAAARLTVLSPQVLSRRLERRLPLLTGGPRDLPERQRTMRAALAWSYDLLDAEERALFRRLSVFVGGCRLEAALAVSDDVRMLDAVTDVMGALLEKSLLQRSFDADSEPRFTMLETVREYGRERLDESGEAAVTLRRQAEHFLAFAEHAAPGLIGPDQAQWLLRLEEDRDNLRATLQWAREGEADSAADRLMIGLRMAGALWRFWFRRGYLDEGRRWLEDLLASTPDEGPIVARAIQGAAGLAWARGAYEHATALAGRSLALHRSAGDLAGVADALQMLGVIAADRADYTTAAARAEECLALRRTLGDTWGTATALNNLGAVAHQRGNYAQAENLYEECLALKRDLGDTAGVAVTLRNLGDVLVAQQQYERGAALIEESLALNRRLGVTEAVNPALTSLAVIARRLGDAERARALLEESLMVARDQGARAYEALVLVNLGNLAYDRGAFAQALGLYKEGLGLAYDFGQQSELAYGFEGVAAVAHALGQSAAAARLYGMAAALRRAIGTPITPVERSDYDRGVAAVQASLGDDALAACWAAGQALSVECAADEALALEG